ncbi:hypothetical protein Esti_002223 [Eimeria stiedai]
MAMEKRPSASKPRRSSGGVEGPSKRQASLLSFFKKSTDSSSSLPPLQQQQQQQDGGPPAEAATQQSAQVAAAAESQASGSPPQKEDLPPNRLSAPSTPPSRPTQQQRQQVQQQQQQQQDEGEEDVAVKEWLSKTCWEETEEAVPKRRRLTRVALDSDEEASIQEDSGVRAAHATAAECLFKEETQEEKSEGEAADHKAGSEEATPIAKLEFDAAAANAAAAKAAAAGGLPLGSGRRSVGGSSSAPLSRSSSSGCGRDSALGARSRLHAAASRLGSLYLHHFADSLASYGETFSFPPWLHPEGLRDAAGRLAVSDEAYNPSTLWVPGPQHPMAREHRAPHYTPGMQQYWEVKRAHHDKLVLFKMGRFYELFYVDACIAHAVCNLKWMGSTEKPHCGFPEQSLQHHTRGLVNAGFKVVVVEQMETPKELERRRNAEGVRDKAVKREPCEVLTAGSIPHPEMLEADARLLLVLFASEHAADQPLQQQDQQQQQREEEQGEPRAFGAVLMDAAANKMFLGGGRDNAGWWRLRGLLAQSQPVEVVYGPGVSPPAVMSLLKRLPCLPQLSPLQEYPDTLKALQLVETHIRSRVRSSNSSSSSDGVEYCLSECDKNPCLLRAVGAACLYLEQLLLDSKLLPLTLFLPLNASPCLLLSLDAKALTQLEVLTSQEGDPVRSLLGCIDNTVTPGGKRLLRRWVVGPLRCTDTINARLDAVQWLLQHDSLLSLLRKGAASLPDIERLGLQQRRQAVYFGDVHQKQLKAFLSLLDSFDGIERLAAAVVSELEAETAAAAAGDAAAAAAAAAGTVWPHKLWLLCAGKEKGGSFPQLKEETSRLRLLVHTKADGLLVPKPGLVPEFDSASAALSACEAKLDAILQELQATTGQSSLKFTHTKFKYEVECPENISKETLRRLEADITSTRKGFIRFRTPAICELAEEQEELELAVKDAFYPFRSRLTAEFSRIFHETFEVSIHCMNELDVLQSLTTFARTHPGPEMTRPKLLPPSEAEEPVLLLRNARHPMAEKLTDSFVPNDVLLSVSPNSSSSDCSSCSSSSSSSGRTLLITGPNMGGKSTLLRQTALCVVLAQMGSYVPASECVLTPVDRIFTRLGAEDFILQGSSTFFVELSDIAELTAHGSRYSLALIDELGRGTSTSDGLAIALSTAEYITDCRCLFATHYHTLCYELRQHPGVRNVHLGATISEETVSFEYRVRDGICPNSQGLLVAKLAGIPQHVLDCATKQAYVLQQQAAQQQREARLRSVAAAMLTAVASNPQELRCMFTRFKAEVLADAQEQRAADAAGAAAVHAAATASH